MAILDIFSKPNDWFDHAEGSVLMTAALRICAAFVLGWTLTALPSCQQEAAKPTHEPGHPAGTESLPTASAPGAVASASPPPLTAASGTRQSKCAEIEAGWRTAIGRFARKPVDDCKRDEDCDCYGGFKCPNGLIEICPSPIRADVAAELNHFDKRWHARKCGEIIWSPHDICKEKCVSGRCR